MRGNTKRPIRAARSRSKERALVTLSAVIHREGDLYVAECPELGTVSQGKTLEEAVANLKEATGLYLEEQEEPPAFAPAILTTFSIDTANAEAA
jgi:predicted RNase H-like HicB family nuclease